MTNIFNLQSDVMALIALDLDLPSILNYCLTDSKFDSTVCESKSFWRNKYMKDFPGSKPLSVDNPRRFYELFLKRYQKNPKLLPINFYIPIERNENFVKLHILVQESPTRDIFHSLCNVEELRVSCDDPDTWKHMINLFYSYIKGNFEEYKAKHFPRMSWRDFYYKVVHSPSLLQTGF